MSDELEPIVVNLNTEQWNHLMEKVWEEAEYSPSERSSDESLTSEEELAMLAFIEESDEDEEPEEAFPQPLPEDSEEDYEWVISEGLID
jgi:hypothetical protein